MPYDDGPCTRKTKIQINKNKIVVLKTNENLEIKKHKMESKIKTKIDGERNLTYNNKLII